MTAQLEPTGERLIEEHYLDSPSGYAIYLMHAASYVFASQYCSGKRVLDLGCGSGYGAAQLAEVANHVQAIDVSTEAIAYARDRYSRDNVDFECVPIGAQLPYADASFDVVVSFQVIEHVRDADSYLAEAARVLAPGGHLLLITPDRKLRLLPHQRPWNRWHLHEYDPKSLRNLVERRFDVRELLSMGAKPEVARIEVRRYRVLKWTTLPFTFPGSPEAWRVFGLGLLHRLRGLGKRKPGDGYRPEFGMDAIEIRSAVDLPLNIVVVATPRPISITSDRMPDRSGEPIANANSRA